LSASQFKLNLGRNSEHGVGSGAIRIELCDLGAGTVRIHFPLLRGRALRNQV